MSLWWKTCGLYSIHSWSNMNTPKKTTIATGSHQLLVNFSLAACESLRMMLQQSDGFSAAEVLEIKVRSFPVGCRGPVGCLKKTAHLFGDKRYFHPLSPNYISPFLTRWKFSHLIWPDLQETFRKFDEDGSGDIDVCELSDMLRFQGHAASIDEATWTWRKTGKWRNNQFQGKQTWIYTQI